MSGFRIRKPRLAILLSMAIFLIFFFNSKDYLGLKDMGRTFKSAQFDFAAQKYAESKNTTVEKIHAENYARNLKQHLDDLKRGVPRCRFMIKQKECTRRPNVLRTMIIAPTTGSKYELLYATTQLLFQLVEFFVVLFFSVLAGFFIIFLLPNLAKRVWQFCINWLFEFDSR